MVLWIAGVLLAARVLQRGAGGVASAGAACRKGTAAVLAMSMLLLLLLLLLQVVYLESVVAKLLVGHRNSSQHSQVLAQHKAGAVTPQTQVRRQCARCCGIVLT